MKLTLKLALIIVLFTHEVSAQIANIQGLDNVVIRAKKYEDIKGSAYLYPSWSSGTITDKTGRLYSNLLLKYDAYKDQVELNQEGQAYEISAVLYPKFTLNYVDPATNDITRHSFAAGYKIGGFSELNYFDLLQEGKYTLLRKYKTSFIEENVSGYGTSGVQKSFQSKMHYFVLDTKGVAKEIKMNRKSLLETFPDQGSALEAFIREKKLKVKSVEDVIEIIKFLEGIEGD